MPPLEINDLESFVKDLVDIHREQTALATKPLLEHIKQQDERIEQLEVADIEKGAALRLLKELVMNNHDATSSPPTKTAGPFGPAPRISRSRKSAH